MEQHVKRGRGARIISAALSLIFLLSMGGCIRREPDDKQANAGDEPFEIVDDTPLPVTAGPTCTPSPTPDPTEVPTETPAPTPTPKPTAAPTEKADPAPKKKVMYLTFDDGPYKYTDEVLDILDEYGIKATFFTIGNCIKAYPKQAKRIVKDGHVLACHTQSHDFSILYHGTEGFIKDVDRWRQTVIDAVGYDAGAYVLRFPGGTTNTTIGGRKGRDPYVKAVNKHGYLAFDWNLGLNDRWLAGNKKNLPLEDYFWESYIAYIGMVSNVEPRIFLIHDTEPVSVHMLRRVIDDLISRGYEFGVLTDLKDNYLM